jgi:hypothetical protein
MKDLITYTLKRKCVFGKYTNNLFKKNSFITVSFFMLKIQF